jgi:hypothetical protein
MTSFMLYNEYMNTSVHIHVSVSMTIRFIASIILFAARAANIVDLANSALLPNEAGASCLT